jgi:hypothetical protein
MSRAMYTFDVAKPPRGLIRQMKGIVESLIKYKFNIRMSKLVLLIYSISNVYVGVPTVGVIEGDHFH